MDEYPVMAGGARVGTLKVTQKGLLTVFDASAIDNGEVFRISVYGGGEEGYLGVMWPEKGALRLIKRFSRAAMADFPEVIEYAGQSGERSSPPSPSGAQPAVPRQDERVMPECGDTLWYSAPDGTLSTFDGQRLLIAMPADEVSVPKGSEGVLRRINGREYIVFPR
ncbi:MAG: hypothetical protein EOM54_08135 [Clostridia bacterium]|nr:hypothetical protein [Clostridia bacterium]